MVKRYGMYGASQYVSESEAGDYVRHEDYEALVDVLKDIRSGAILMQEPALNNPPLRRYAAEVQRVVDLALAAEGRS